MNRCCGLRLSTFGMIIGWLQLVSAFFSSVIFIIAITRLDEIVKYIVAHTNNENIDEAQLRTVLQVVIWFIIFIDFVNLVVSALLIVGTVKERHLLLLPWLVNNFISIAIATVLVVFLLYATIASKFDQPTFPLLISQIIGLAIACAIWNAIYALFKEIRNSREERLLSPILSEDPPSYPSYAPLQ